MGIVVRERFRANADQGERTQGKEAHTNQQIRTHRFVDSSVLLSADICQGILVGVLHTLLFLSLQRSKFTLRDVMKEAIEEFK